MPATIIEKIISAHYDQVVKPGDIADVDIDVRIARDFGGANVVKNLQDHNLGIHNPAKTFFTFDCNPGGSDQKYATNQHVCRMYARDHGVTVYDINAGIGTHLAIDQGLVGPGGTLVSTDSHANILGAIGAFGQGMGDQDIAAAFAHGKVWFKVPPTVKVILDGQPSSNASAKDIVLACLKHFGANGLLGYAAEFYGSAVDDLTLDQRITIASMATEMGGIIALFPPNEAVIRHCRQAGAAGFEPIYADSDADYADTFHIDIDDLEPLISRPGHPEDVVPVSQVSGTKIDSAFIGSCTNGRLQDLRAAAGILTGRKVAPGVVLKIVPSTDRIWRHCLDEGLIAIFKQAGALVGNPGCAGCAAGQIGQNGPGEVTVSTGNRNFAGKQGKGDVWLASPATVAASALAGIITTAQSIPTEPVVFAVGEKPITHSERSEESRAATPPAIEKPTVFKGRLWVIPIDNIDTDMIFHNRYLTITDIAQMGQYTFDNLKGWENFAHKAQPGDIVLTGKNFGCGSSRQQAVDCFKSLGISLIVAQSFGAIYQRNAINAGFPVMTAELTESDVQDGHTLEVNVQTGQIRCLDCGKTFQGTPFSQVQIQIYQRGGLLEN
jgi:3-isopropylmalate/(R)-2-methylmalate dehydratase large subunit